MNLRLRVLQNGLRALRPASWRRRRSPVRSVVTVGLLVLEWFLAVDARADTSGGSSSDARICLVAPRGQSELLEDALHRIVAELHAVGFVVERVEPAAPNRHPEHGPQTLPRTGCRGADGHLLLRPSAVTLSILASARAEDTPVRQDLRLSEKDTTAEVIAIRSVEGLRAAMIQAMRSRQSGPSPPESIRRFTRYSAESASTASPSEGPAPSATSSVPEERGRARADDGQGHASARSAKALFAVGAGVDASAGELGIPAELAVSWRLRALALGALFDASLLPADWDAAAGQVSVRQYSLLGRVAWRAPCGDVVECELGVAFGVRALSMEASDRFNGEVTAENHVSPVVSGDAFAGYFFDPHWGFGARIRAGSLLDAPVVMAAGEQKTWGRPTVAATLLVLARY